MKPGDLVRVVDSMVPAPIEVGDFALLTEIDWDHRDSPKGIIRGSDGKRITGRGYFFFPSKPEVHSKFWRDGDHLGIMLVFETFEVVSEDG